MLAYSMRALVLARHARPCVSTTNRHVKRTQSTATPPTQSPPPSSPPSKQASTPPSASPPPSARGGRGGARWLLWLGALGTAGVAALVALDVPEDAPPWLHTSQAHTRTLFRYEDAPPRAPTKPTIERVKAPQGAIVPSPVIATPSARKEDIKAHEDTVKAKPHEEKEETQASARTPVAHSHSGAEPTDAPDTAVAAADAAVSAAPDVPVSAPAPTPALAPAPVLSAVPAAVASPPADDLVPVAELRARIAALEQRGSQSELSQLVHEFQRERVAAYEAHVQELTALQSDYERALSEQRREHTALLDGAEARLRVEYEATVARLGTELAASYAQQLERVLAARDADVAREYAIFSARVQDTLVETDAVTRAVLMRAEDVQHKFEALRGEHGSANDALQLADATTALRVAVLAAAPLETALQRTHAAASAFPAVHAALSAVPAAAHNGVQSHATLSAQLSTLEPAARRAADSSASSKLKEWLVQPPAGLVQGDDAASVLARARFHAERGALAAALDEVNTLPPASQDVLKEWRGNAAARVQVDEALALADAQIAAHAQSFRNGEMR